MEKPTKKEERKKNNDLFYEIFFGPNLVGFFVF